jgi:HEAT repeat protein
MFTEILAPFIGISVIAMALLALLLLGRRLRRDHDFRVSTKRRRHYAQVLRAGTRTELLATAHSVRSRQGRQADFAVVLRDELQGLRADRHAQLNAAALESGLAARLIRQLRSGRAMRRGRAVLIISRLKLRGTVPALASLLSDPDPDVRFAAAHGIAVYESDEAARALIDAIGRETMPPERIVEQVAHPWAVPELISTLNRGEHRNARPLLAEALGLAGDRRALATLTALLTDRADEVRVAACRALARLAEPSSFDAVAAAMSDDFDPVRAQAARALAAIGDRRAVPFLEQGLSDPFWWMRANCADALRAMGDAGNDALERAVHSTDRFARDRAQEALTLNVALGRRSTQLVQA